MTRPLGVLDFKFAPIAGMAVPVRSSAAARMQAYRARVRDGLVVLPLQVNEVAVVEMLIAGGLLAPADADDREKVASALEQQIANLIALARDA